MSPDVSIIIPTFNRADVVERAVGSCLTTIDGGLEAIVVDDGSDDNTRRRLADVFAGGPVAGETGEFDCTAGNGNVLRYRWFPHEGPCPARNRGLQIAAGEFVKFLDSDDELIPGALAEEIDLARGSGADVVVTAWEEQAEDGSGRPVGQRTRRAVPRMERGVDDMLLGHAPWTSAALYRQEAVAGLGWDPECEKAQDWDWAWTVCLSGARFVCLDIPSAVYNQRDDARVSGAGDPLLRSTSARHRILSRVEAALRERGELTPERCRLLARYFYKDSRVICEQSRRDWFELWAHCRELDPGFMPAESDPAVRFLNRVFGPATGITFYVQLRRMARVLGMRRQGSAAA